MDHSDIESIDLSEIYIHSDTSVNDNNTLLTHPSREGTHSLSQWFNILLFKLFLFMLLFVLPVSIICLMIIIIKDIYD